MVGECGSECECERCGSGSERERESEMTAYSAACRAHIRRPLLHTCIREEQTGRSREDKVSIILAYLTVPVHTVKGRLEAGGRRGQVAGRGRGRQ